MTKGTNRTKTTKLSLRRETLRPLNSTELHLVAGGKPGCYGHGTTCGDTYR